MLFARGEGTTRRILVSHRHGADWSAAEPISFSGPWMDLEPVLAPDGSYLVFVSNRPATAGGSPIDGYFGGKARSGRGGNLWRVDRAGRGWGTPVRLPDIVNAGTSTYSPALAADGSLYFMRPDPRTGHFRLYLSRFADGRLQSPQPLSFSDGTSSDVDPAVAPDQSFIVFSSNRPPTPAGSNNLFITFATGAGWGKPIPLGPSGDESRLAPDLATLYFSAADNRIHRLPITPWLARYAKTQP